MTPLALLDACVLVPDWLRDLFLRCASEGLFRLRWSETILDEVERTLVTDLLVPAEKASRARSKMAEAFDESFVSEFEALIPAMQNHPKDRHVLAAAAHAAEVEQEPVALVTFNLKDFPSASLPPGVLIQSPDAFLCSLFDASPASSAVIVDIIWAHARRRTRPPVAVEELLKGLSRQVPFFVQRVRALIDVRTASQLDQLWQRFHDAQKSGSPIEQLVSLQDLLLADSELSAEVTRTAIQNRTVFIQGFLNTLRKNDAASDAMWALLQEWGVNLPRSEVAKLTAEQLDELLQSARHTRS